VIAPSGEQITINWRSEAVVVEVGGGLRSSSARGLECVDAIQSRRDELLRPGSILMPWPNRLQDGSYEFDGWRHLFPLNEPERRNAIHGLVRWATWTVAEQEPHRAVMKHVLHPQPGYPLTSIPVKKSVNNSGESDPLNASSASRVSSSARSR